MHRIAWHSFDQNGGEDGPLIARLRGELRDSRLCWWEVEIMRETTEEDEYGRQ